MDQNSDALLVSGADLLPTYGFTSPVLVLEDTNEGYVNQVLSWETDNHSSYMLRPFKQTPYQGDHTFYGLSDKNDCLVILTYDFPGKYQPSTK